MPEPNRSSSALALASVGAKRVALLADEDDARLRIIALADGQEIASAKLDGMPGHVVVDSDGIAWVSIRDADVVTSFGLSCTGDTRRVATTALAREPRALLAACHQNAGKKGDGSKRDVGTGRAFDTPSLLFVGGTALYMHDGRYATLREVLVGTDGKMGHSSHLPEADVQTLIAYLRAL